MPEDIKKLHNTNAVFKNYYREEVLNMTKLDMFLFLFTVEYIKEILITETNNNLKHSMCWKST